MKCLNNKCKLNKTIQICVDESKTNKVLDLNKEIEIYIKKPKKQKTNNKIANANNCILLL
jgi:hypothetical protein